MKHALLRACAVATSSALLVAPSIARAHGSAPPPLVTAPPTSDESARPPSAAPEPSPTAAPPPSAAPEPSPTAAPPPSAAPPPAGVPAPSAPPPPTAAPSAAPLAPAPAVAPGPAPASYPPTTPMVAYGSPPPEPEVRKGKAPYLHDGFFFRGAIGPGLFRAWTGGSDTRHFSGGTVSGEIAMGGTPAKGFVFGGSILINKVFGLSSHDDIVDGDEPSLDGVNFSLNAFGVFADYYPDPKAGLDFHLFLGVGNLVTVRPNDQGLDQPSGILWSAGVGYDWFVGPQLSLGVHARLSGGGLDVNETASGDRTVTALVPALLFAVTYH